MVVAGVRWMMSLSGVHNSKSLVCSCGRPSPSTSRSVVGDMYTHAHVDQPDPSGVSRTAGKCTSKWSRRRVHSESTTSCNIVRMGSALSPGEVGEAEETPLGECLALKSTSGYSVSRSM